MDGSLTEWVWPASATFRLNGHANAKRSDSARRNSHIRTASPLEDGLRFRETGFQGQRQLAEIPSTPELVSAETTALRAKPTCSGPFGAKREIPKFERVRGGGRTQYRTCLCMEF